jgi:hypothetical protein
MLRGWLPEGCIPGCGGAIAVWVPDFLYQRQYVRCTLAEKLLLINDYNEPIF